MVMETLPRDRGHQAHTSDQVMTRPSGILPISQTMSAPGKQYKAIGDDVWKRTDKVVSVL